mmetsp:Transcript_15499/g.18682  ORF Transcript_15499/g.18682 Transcript_15499/m.18682 type:complete len:213 (-) Transcript_15499:44-682(-)
MLAGEKNSVIASSRIGLSSSILLKHVWDIGRTRCVNLVCCFPVARASFITRVTNSETLIRLSRHLSRHIDFPSILSFTNIFPELDSPFFAPPTSDPIFLVFVSFSSLNACNSASRSSATFERSFVSSSSLLMAASVLLPTISSAKLVNQLITSSAALFSLQSSQVTSTMGGPGVTPEPGLCPHFELFFRFHPSFLELLEKFLFLLFEGIFYY